MDVTCERCGTEYEFDETLVSDRGTTVKCTNCGHLFKVFRPDVDGGGRHWHVESTNGALRTLGSLQELQRLISQGALTSEDRISRGGRDDWKRLGDIAELTTFFEAAAAGSSGRDAAERSTVPGKSAARAPSDRPVQGPPVSPGEPPAAPSVRRSKRTMMGVGPDPVPPPPSSESSGPPWGSPPPPAAPAQPAPIAPPAPVSAAPRRAAPPPPPAPSSRPPPLKAPMPEASATGPSTATEARPAPVSDPPPRPTHPARPSNRPLYLDEHEPVVPGRAKSRSGLWVALVLILAAGVGVALAWPQIAPLLGLAEVRDPAGPHVTSGDEALARDDLAGYERAVHHYTQALQHDERSARVLTGLSRAHALWAQALMFDAADLDARAAQGSARPEESSASRAEVQRHAESALQRAEDAVRYGAGDADAELALADALRLTGDAVRGRSRLDRALTLRSTPSAEALRVAALLDAATSGGDLAAARPRAEDAVAEDLGSIRARLLLARALLAARDVGAARRQVETILRRDGQHPAALALRDAIDQGRPPAPPTVEIPSGETPPAGETSPPPALAPTPSPSASPAEPMPTAPSAPTGAAHDAPPSSRREEDRGGAIPSGRDYSWYIRQGDDRLERGDVARAAAFYEAARGVRLNGPEALTGLGQVSLERGDATGAAGLFRQAASFGYAEAYMGLGAAYRRAGRLQDAVTAYRGYLDRLPSGPRAPQARRNIEAIREQLTAAPAPREAASETPLPEETPTAPPPPGASTPPSGDEQVVERAPDP